jgi:two-component system chemotaxis sensor kinase CheA
MLKQELPDLVISDVEMPRLDGFGLLEAIRKDPELRSLPVVMVTSMDKREHRQRGLDLGADAYMVKQHFDQSALLETIRRLL